MDDIEGDSLNPEKRIEGMLLIVRNNKKQNYLHSFR